MKMQNVSHIICSILKNFFAFRFTNLPGILNLSQVEKVNRASGLPNPKATIAQS